MLKLCRIHSENTSFENSVDIQFVVRNVVDAALLLTGKAMTYLNAFFLEL